MSDLSFTPIPKNSDVLIIGAGAAGLMCAFRAGQRGRSVLVLDHANKVGKKILMSGGGRCNFTNLYCEPDNFLSNNKNFCKSALSRYTSYDFIELVRSHDIPYHEKTLGQLFCDNKSKDILEMLLNECNQAGVKVRTHCSVEQINPLGSGYEIKTSLGTTTCESLVIATGGLSIPKMGATGFAYQVAKQFDLEVLPTRAGLVPFTLNQPILNILSQLSGSSIEVVVTCNAMSFHENLLFTHRGLSGPAMLQISSYWNQGDELTINLLPKIDLYEYLKDRKSQRPKVELKTLLSELMTKNIAQTLIHLWFSDDEYSNKQINQFSNQQLQEIADHFHSWKLKPNNTEGYRTAEVTLGGINCNELSSKTMQANKKDNLYFIGEAIDVAGHLGGFNFQWAWASGAAASEFV
ncbi:MAG: aminoacetone oxidase family FAD-binding enzyme [Gammaproteobacteria bacterium]|nr:MAG: aminoacetone oxidase family FAD-binding enzyme [Gammaproteobacteria bacterium]